MKKLLGILLLTISTLFCFGQNNLQTTKANKNSFPTNLDGKNFGKLKKFNGKIVAYDGIIENIETSRNNTPFYKIKIENEDYLWTVLMFNNDANKIGDTIRVVGYLRPIPNKSEINNIERSYLDGKFMVIAFGLVDFKNSNFLFLSGANEQKQEWINGKIPSAK
ncbi:MAG TPA: hypothetical protein PKX92_03490 [Edaphocola sp.]|nr:hypothetical protein [Edaphocola sp.]